MGQGRGGSGRRQGAHAGVAKGAARRPARGGLPPRGAQLRQLIQKTAKPDDVGKVARQLEADFAGRLALARQVSRRIIAAERLETYGTPPA